MWNCAASACLCELRLRDGAVARGKRERHVHSGDRARERTHVGVGHVRAVLEPLVAICEIDELEHVALRRERICGARGARGVGADLVDRAKHKPHASAADEPRDQLRQNAGCELGARRALQVAELDQRDGRERASQRDAFLRDPAQEGDRCAGPRHRTPGL